MDNEDLTCEDKSDSDKQDGEPKATDEKLTTVPTIPHLAMLTIPNKKMTTQVPCLT